MAIRTPLRSPRQINLTRTISSPARPDTRIFWFRHLRAQRPGKTPVLYGIDISGNLVTIDASNGQKTTVDPIAAFVRSGSGAGFTFSEQTKSAYVSFAKPAGPSTADQFLSTMSLTTARTALAGAVGHFPTGIVVIARRMFSCAATGRCFRRPADPVADVAAQELP